MIYKNDRSESRRTVLKTVAAGFGIATVPAGVVANENHGSREQRNEAVTLELKGGELAFANLGQLRKAAARRQGVKKRGPPRELQDETGEVVWVNPDESDFETALEAINDAKDEGEISFDRRDDEIVVVPEDDASSGNECSAGDVTVHHHGRTDWDTSISWRYGIRDTLWMDDDLTRDVYNTLTITGGITGAAALITKATVVGIPATVLLGILTILQATGVALLLNNNNGHGVRIRAYRLITWVQVRPQ